MDSFNPNKRGMPAASKGGACWRFFSSYCCTLPPPFIPARATSWRKNSNWFKLLLWYCFYTKQYQKRGIGVCSFLLFWQWKGSCFEVFIKFKKNGHTFCNPYQIFKKLFNLRHHGVKSFWTKIGDFSPMPLLLGLTYCYKHGAQGATRAWYQWVCARCRLPKHLSWYFFPK